MDKRIQPIALATERQARQAQIAALFPDATGADLADHWAGGRTAALQRLHAVDARQYARTRNHLQGAVTRLSPYLRHGCLTLAESIDHVRSQAGAQGQKLLSELAYRDYFRQVWFRFGRAIMRDMEASKVILGRQPLSTQVMQGKSGLVCMDSIVHTLQHDGYVHNHARMWFAAYVLHWLNTDWRQAADWFEAQLLDGDLASNHLSWQWVASSFSHKPYYFNRDNLRQFGGEHWCQTCRARCPFDDSYEALAAKLFTEAPAVAQRRQTSLATPIQRPASHQPQAVWVHDEMLNATHPLLASGLPAIFVLDSTLYGHWPRKRLQFMADCLAEMPTVEVWQGPTANVFKQLGLQTLTSQRTPQTRLHEASNTLHIRWEDAPAIHGAALSDHDLMRFSRYWKKVEPYVMGGF